jgi:tetratricopeptide (TPR) repeat protein
MKRFSGSLVPVVVFFSLLFLSLASLAPLACAQIDKIVIPAGTPEDHDLQSISSEADAAKKLGMYQEFVQKYSANPAAVTYGDWQISQAYAATGDFNKALEYGDKALAGTPRNLDILVSQGSIAQQAKNNSKLMEYVARGGVVCGSIEKQPKPDGMSDDDFKRQVAEDKSAAQNSCDFMESAGFNVIASENDAKSRMAYIEEYSAAFPASKYQEQVSNYAMYTLGPGQLNDQARLLAYGEKTLAANPNSLPALLLMAGAYIDDAKVGSVAKAIGYSQKAITVANADAPDADKSRKLSAGVAHSIVGYGYIKEDKTAAAIPELKSAAGLLKGQDDQQYSVTLYRLGFAYAKLNKVNEARDVLTEAVKVPGPAQSMSQDLLTKVNAARAKGR